MERRHFLRTLAAVAAGAVLDPELLLWKPGAKTVFLPSRTSLVSGVAVWVMSHQQGLIRFADVYRNGQIDPYRFDCRIQVEITYERVYNLGGVSHE